MSCCWLTHTHTHTHILEKRNWCRANGFYRNSNLPDVSTFCSVRLNCWCRDKMGDNKARNDEKSERARERESEKRQSVRFIGIRKLVPFFPLMPFSISIFFHNNFSQQQPMVSIWSAFSLHQKKSLSQRKQLAFIVSWNSLVLKRIWIHN